MAQRRKGILAAALAILSFSIAHSAGSPGSMPMPRVEPGGHTGFIKKLSVDQAGADILTVSDDKTARLWDAKSGRLLQVFRVPIENGHEGQLYAAALSPDGRIAAVGGFTGFFEQGRSTVYFFDTASGSMVSRLLNLSDAAIENLVFSDDGKVLAVCLADGRGVRIFNLQSGALLRSYENTRDKILGAGFSRNGDLAISTLDGNLWVFRATAKYEAAIVRLAQGRLPMHVQFSPDSTELVVGFDGDATFSIVDAQTLKEVYAARLPEAAGQRGLHVVEWSDDGEYLYAGGETIAGFDAPIYRFAQRGRGIPQPVLTSTKRISDMRRLPNGAIAFTSGEPEVGVIEATGRVRWRYRSPTIDLRRMAADFRLSPSANSVMFGTADRSTAFAFDVLLPPESALKRTSLPARDPAANRQDLLGWKIVVSADQEHLSVNGIDAVLDNREVVRNRAFTPDGNKMIVGTSWSLRMFDRGGKQQWIEPMTADVNLTTVSDDGQSIVTALSDGTIRWHRTKDGKEFLALFANRNGQDWIAWIPSGYYTSSLSGDNYIGWHVNRGADRDPSFYRAVQFERVLYRPDIVHAYFNARGDVSLDKLVGADAFDIALLDSVAPPSLRLSTIKVPTTDNKQLVSVKVSGESTSLPLKDWSLFLNGIPVTPSSERTLSGPETHAFKREVTLELPAKLNRLRLESTNGRSIGVAEIEVDAASTSQPVQGDLYVIAVGASDFVDPALNDLKFASRDAVEFSRVFQTTDLARGFRSVKSLVLADTSPAHATRADLEKLDNFLAPAQGNDTVIVFLASHGISDPKGNYFFVPREGTLKDMLAVQRGEQSAPSLVRWDFFVDLLRNTAGRRILIVDTCSSGALGSTFDVHSLAKRSLSSSFALVAASKGSEKSQELPSQQHGLFTYGLIEALRTGYDPDANGKVTLSEAFEFAFDKVQTLRNKGIGQQTPQLNAPDILADVPLVTIKAGAVTAAIERKRSP